MSVLTIISTSAIVITMKQKGLLGTLSALSLLIVLSLILIPSVTYADTKTFEPSRDTYIDEKLPNSSYGTIGLGTIGHEVVGSYSRMVLLHFDVSSIPTGSTINSAKLSVRVGGCTGTAADLGHTSLGAYITNGSQAWSESSTYQQLSTSGSSLDGIGSQIVPCSTGSYVDLNAVELVKAWVDRIIPNDGLYLSPVGGANNWARVIYTREATAASRPKLSVDYSVPYEVVETPDGPPMTNDSSTSNSNTATAPSISQPIDPDETLSPPTKLTATQTDTSLDVQLKWDKSQSEGVEHYRIFRVGADGTDVKIGEVAGSEAQFTDNTAEANKQYGYYLRAVRNQKESANTDSVQIKVQSITKDATQSPEVLKKTNDQLGKWLSVSIVATLVAVTAFCMLTIKHKKLHQKHKELIKAKQKEL